MERILHELTQGSDAWHAFRLNHDGASEAAPMLGLSKNVTRTELLRAKSTGIAKEFSDFVQTRILDHGHAVEALARPIAEKLIGDDLYPATYSLGKLSASCDGLTMDDVTAFEHKQFNAELAAAVKRGELPEEHMPQCQQVLMVTGAQQLLFMVSDGTEENMESMYIRPSAKWFERIKAGWAMFHQDLAEFKPVEVLPPVTAAPVMALPALSIQVNGAITLTDNLAVFGAGLKAFIERLPTKPETDQQFADCKAALTTLKEAENALDAAEAHALGQMASFDTMKRAKAMWFDLSRTTRLALEKLVVAEEQNIKTKIVQAARSIYNAHVESLKAETGGPWIVIAEPDFAGAVKGKRTISGLQNAVDTVLANGKIAADASAKLIRANLACLKSDGAGYEFLFNDSLALISKPIDDLRNLIKIRIDGHKSAEANKLEAAREKIRQEEQAKAQREADAKVAADRKAEQDATDARARQNRADQEAEDKRINTALAAEESRLQAERKAAQEESDRLNVEQREAEAERQRGLDTHQIIVGLYERIKADKKYSALAKACLACIERAQQRAA